jgi:hypothetical protein
MEVPLRRHARFAAACVTVIVLLDAPAVADSLRVAGEAIEGVYLIESPRLYYALNPDDGSVRSIEKTSVDPLSVVITIDEDARAGLYARWQEAKDRQDPLLSLAPRAPSPLAAPIVSSGLEQFKWERRIRVLAEFESTYAIWKGLTPEERGAIRDYFLSVQQLDEEESTFLIEREAANRDRTAALLYENQLDQSDREDAIDWDYANEDRERAAVYRDAYRQSYRQPYFDLWYYSPYVNRLRPRRGRGRRSAITVNVRGPSFEPAEVGRFSRPPREGLDLEAAPTANYRFIDRTPYLTARPSYIVPPLPRIDYSNANYRAAKVSSRHEANRAELQSNLKHLAREERGLRGRLQRSEAYLRGNISLAENRAFMDQNNLDRLNALDHALANDYVPLMRSIRTQRFQGVHGKKTQAFSVKTDLWRIEWKVTASPLAPTRPFSLRAYLVAQEEPIARVLSRRPVRERFLIVKGPGEFFLDLSSDEGTSYEVNIYEINVPDAPTRFSQP